MRKKWLPKDYNTLSFLIEYNLLAIQTMYKIVRLL